jgi:hypothetical protein|tara:strand:- start:29 stop:337 length:309 start_codon:yes stop_codon:yes gene_type:complete
MSGVNLIEWDCSEWDWTGKKIISGSRLSAMAGKPRKDHHFAKERALELICSALSSSRIKNLMKGAFIFIMFVLQKVACFAQLAPKDPFLVAGSLGGWFRADY